VRERGCLRKQSAIDERDGEIRVGLALDEYVVLNQIVAGGKTLDVDVELATTASKTE
jgi:hypothetical protein